LAEIVCLRKPTYDLFTQSNVTQRYRAILDRSKLYMLVGQVVMKLGIGELQL